MIPQPDAPLPCRQQPRLSLEEAIQRHGLEGYAFLSSGTAWGDLTTAASVVPAVARCLHVETKFMQPERFLADLQLGSV